MTRLPRIAKRLILPVLLAAVLVFAVQAVLAAPAPDFTFSQAAGQPATGCKTVNFTNASTDSEDPENNAEQIDWDLDNDGSFDDTTGETASRVFPAIGTYTVGISATDTDGTGGTVSATKPVTVTSNAPTSTIDIPDNVQAGVAAQYTATGGDADGSVVSYAWDFDNDGFDDGTGPTVSHTYTAAGAQTARVQVTDNCNAQGIGTAQVTVGVAQAPPVPSFTMQVSNADVTTVNPGTQVTFTSTSTDPNSDTLTYSWSLDGDNTFDDGTTQSVTKTYPTFATVKTVRVRLSVSDGVSPAVQTFQDLVINKAPFGAFTISPEAPLIGEAVTFDAAASFDFENGIATYEWDFDYGGTPASFAASATQSSASHAFTTPGAKAVALRVTDADGGVTVVPRTVTVQVTRPNAGLTFSPQNPLPGQSVTLTSTSSPSASPGAPSLEATQWDFDYQPTADFTLEGAGGSIVTSFASPGPHTVAVKVTQTGGGFAIATDTIVVNAPPQASFTVAPAKPVEGKQVTFASTSGDPDGALAKQEWDLNNDGKYERSGAVVSTSSLKKGTRLVRLLVTDSKGATATSLVPVKVAAKPLKNPPDINSTVSWSPRAGGITLVSLTVKVPSNTSVAVSCKGGGCPRGTFHKHSKKKKGARLTFGQLEGRLSGGAKISIIFTRPGYRTGWDTITIRGRGKDRTVQLEGCKISGAKKQKPCP